jgi:hypothetical protein
MDMKVEMKNGEVRLFDMCQDCLLKEQTDALERVKISSLYLTKNPNTRQNLLIVKFNNNTVWMPAWDDELNFLWAYAFLTEVSNWLLKETDPRKPKIYNPEKKLLTPLIDFINEEIKAWKIELKQSPLKEGIILIENQSQNKSAKT